MMDKRVLINGQVADCIATTDRGLLYGDGVFETLAVVAGQLCYPERHLQRLQTGCERLGMAPVDEPRLLQECRVLIERAPQAVIKIIITRGSGGRGYRPPLPSQVTRILQLHDWPDYPESCRVEGVRTRICQTRMGRNELLAGIKHLNRLEQVMARREWDDAAIREGLMLDSGGRLIEGTMSNVFLVKDGVLLTPDLQSCGVAGIIRARVLELAEEHAIAASIQALDLSDLQQAEEVFVCNSLTGIWPVTGVDEWIFRKGPVTRQLQTLLANECAAFQTTGQDKK